MVLPSASATKKPTAPPTAYSPCGSRSAQATASATQAPHRSEGRPRIAQATRQARPTPACTVFGSSGTAARSTSRKNPSGHRGGPPHLAKKISGPIRRPPPTGNVPSGCGLAARSRSRQSPHGHRGGPPHLAKQPAGRSGGPPPLAQRLADWATRPPRTWIFQVRVAAAAATVYALSAAEPSAAAAGCASWTVFGKGDRCGSSWGDDVVC